MKVVINGEVLLYQLTGIPRFAYEVIAQLDNLFKHGEAVLIMPENDTFNHSYKNIEVIKQHKKIRFWSIKVAEKFAKKNNAIYLNLASWACKIKNSVVCLHDIRPLTWDKWNINIQSIKNHIIFKISFYMIYKNAKKIIAISDFEKNEICNYYKIKNRDRLTVVECGWEHVMRIQTDKALEEQFKKEKYYFSIGSVAPHKNFLWVLRAAKYNKDKKFYIAGGIDRALWNVEILNDLPDNVKFLGRISDEEMKTYMQNAEALLFPSYYEGFGIPPLEALALNVPAVVSDIPVMREIFGESVHYIDPDNSAVDLEEILKQPVAPSTAVLEKYTWKNSAKNIYDILCEVTRG